jgi:hypothetical protein
MTGICDVYRQFLNEPIPEVESVFPEVEAVCEVWIPHGGAIIYFTQQLS